MVVRVLIPIYFDFEVLCRRSAPLPLAYMYIECVHYPTMSWDKRGVNRVRVNAQIFFCVGMFIQGLFIISIVK